jgi:hypothetical protein
LAKFQNSFPKVTTGLEPINYREALLSTLLHANISVFTQFSEYTGADCKESGITTKFSKQIKL